MQSKQKYYSIPIPHPGIPGAYYATFGLPGSSTQFVMNHGKKHIFTSLESAEVHGFRAVVEILNRQDGTKEKLPPRRGRPPNKNESSTEHVFSNFIKKEKQ